LELLQFRLKRKTFGMKAALTRNIAAVCLFADCGGNDGDGVGMNQRHETFDESSNEKTAGSTARNQTGSETSMPAAVRHEKAASVEQISERF
jgi:hypothetical protein